jgi:hypothetical protein
MLRASARQFTHMKWYKAKLLKTAFVVGVASLKHQQWQEPSNLPIF